jgi:hypothetical protein
MKKGEWVWMKLWETAAAWGSVPVTEDWKRDRMMGAIELTHRKVKRAPPPPRRLSCEVEYETDKAWLVVIDNQKHWMPKSRCSLHDNETVIEVEDWLWQQKCNAPLEED